MTKLRMMPHNHLQLSILTFLPLMNVNVTGPHVRFVKVMKTIFLLIFVLPHLRLSVRILMLKFPRPLPFPFVMIRLRVNWIRRALAINLPFSHHVEVCQAFPPRGLEVLRLPNRLISILVSANIWFEIHQLRLKPNLSPVCLHSFPLSLHSFPSETLHPIVPPTKGQVELDAFAPKDPESVPRGGYRTVTLHSIDSNPFSFEVALNSTVGDLLVAWNKLVGSDETLRASSMVGSLLPNHELLTDTDIIITSMHKFVDCRCPLYAYSEGPRFPDSPQPRIDLLDFQQGWVATDEMDFYLSLLSGTGLIAMLPCLDFRSDNLDHNATIFDGHLRTFELLPHEEKVATAIIHQRHWIPIVLVHSDTGPLIHTTPDGFQLLSKIQPCLSSISSSLSFDVSPMLDVFPADCGFQAFGWIVSKGLPALDSLPTAVSPLLVEHPVSVKEALRLRAAFRVKLVEDQLHLCLIAPSDLVLGGMGDEIEQNLIRLLESHGVPPEQAQHRAFTVLEKLGRSTISKLLRSSSAWKDLKGLANNLTPKLQLVLPGELSKVIQDKIASGSAFGDRKVKKQGSKPTQTFLKLRAEDVSIPSSIFKEGNDTPLQQIKLADIGPKSRGVIVVNAAQAYPYLKVDLPLSQFGLALLILDHDDTAFHGLGEIIRFPAKYDQTGEPIIATAKLVQLGSSIVSRHFPQTQLRVEEVPNVAIRVLAFRDEIELDWPSFCEHPIKLILNAVPGLRGKNDSSENVLDIWDRQFLTLKMERVKIVDAEIYVAAFRVAEINLQQVLSGSGPGGFYVEPRSKDGRSPNEDFHVVWLGKIDKPQALVKLQTSKQWVSLFRHGNRFGLRTTKDEAEGLHGVLKPLTPFLQSGTLMTFVVGPFPFGATRGSILKIFASWGWAARPTQPKGRAANNLGILWLVQSVAPPEFEIYQLEHADVLVSELQPKRVPGKLTNDIVASAKTFAALKASPAQSSAKDPLIENDPWAGYTPVKVAKPSPKDDHAKFDALVASVEKRVARCR